VFANLYYEFNNYLLDFVFSQHSNLKCALFADVATGAEKTNFGGQQSYPSPAPLTYIQDSSGYAAAFAIPPTPDGYELVYGPTGGANNAPGVSYDHEFPPKNVLKQKFSIWALCSLTDMTLKPVREFATAGLLIPSVASVDTSTFGVQLSTAFQQLIHAV